jgi:hypothetical protein
MPDDPTDGEIDAWERFGYCCACLGCEDHTHVCDRTDEERAQVLREHDEAIAIMLTKGAGRHQRSDGTYWGRPNGRA